MTDVAELQLKVTQTGIPQAVSGLKDVRKAGLGAEDAFNRVKSAAAGTAIGAGIVVGLKAMLTATVEAEAASAQLEARIKSTGDAAGMTKTQLLDLASALQGKTVFDDEAIANAEAMLLTFTRIGKDVFPKAVESILNVSTAMGTDLNSAALQVGKALNDPVKGINALARAGIQFTVDQKATIKSLVDTGKTAEAQTIILGELETQMGGAARAARNTLGGSLKALQNAFGDLLEGDTGSDGVRGTRAAIEQLVATMGSNDTKKAFGEIVSGVASVTGALVSGVNWLVKYNEQLDKTMGRSSNAAGVDVRDAPKSISAYRTSRAAQENMLKRAGVWSAPDKNSDAGYRQRYEALVNSADYKRVSQELEDNKSRVGASFFGADGMQDNYVGSDSSARRRVGTVQRRGASGAPVANAALVSDEGDAPGGTASRISKAADAAARQRDESYARLKESLRTEEEAIAASYAEREAIISGSAKKGSEEETELRKRSAQQRDDELSQLHERKNAELDALRDSLMTEEEAIRSSYERRRAMLDAMPAGEAKDKLAARLAAARDMELSELSSRLQQKRDMVLNFMLTEDEDRAQQRDRELDELRASYEEKLISHEEFLAAKAALEELYDQGVRDRLMRDTAQKIDAYGGMFGALGQLAEQFARGDSKRAKRAFEVAKALNMAQIVMSTAAGIMKANADTPYPMNIVEGIRIAALGAVQLATVSGAQYSGAYDKGGRIPAGKVGIVGEKGMEFVEGPANVTGRNQTKRMLEQASAGGGTSSSAPIVNISTTVTRGGAETRTTASDEKDARDLSRMIDNSVRDVLQREQRQGGILWKRENGG